MLLGIVLFGLFVLLACGGLGAALWAHRGPKVAIPSALALLVFFVALAWWLVRILAAAPPTS